MSESWCVKEKEKEKSILFFLELSFYFLLAEAHWPEPTKSVVKKSLEKLEKKSGRRKKIKLAKTKNPHQEAIL